MLSKNLHWDTRGDSRQRSTRTPPTLYPQGSWQVLREYLENNEDEVLLVICRFPLTPCQLSYSIRRSF